VDSAGNVFVSLENNTVVKITPQGVLSTFATGFDFPVGLALNNSGDLFVANFNGTTISEVTPAGSVSTFASGLNSPSYLAFGPSAVPEPSAVVMFTLGVGGLLAACRHQRRPRAD
jgi:hypothetical protein